MMLQLAVVVGIVCAAHNDIRDDASYYEYVSPRFGHKDQNVNLLGTDTVFEKLIFNISSHGHDISVVAKKHTAIFHNNYKEVELTPDGRYVVTKVGVPQCHYRGYFNIKGHKSKGIASFEVCRGGVTGAFQHPEINLEIQYLKDENKHVSVDLDNHLTTEAATCGVMNHEGASLEHAVDERGHGMHDHDHSDVELSAADACTGGATKYVDTLIVNDERRYAVRGIDVQTISASIFGITHLRYFGDSDNGVPGITGGDFNCKVELRLIGQMTWKNGAPSSIRRVTTDCKNTCGGNNCGTNEVSINCLLPDFRTWSRNEKTELENLFGDIDNFMMLSDEDMSGSTAGLAYVGTMCGSSSASINQATYNSQSLIAVILAHEMGHNFGIGHDGTDMPGNIMAPSVSSTRKTWSTYSQTQIDSFFASRNPDCLDVDRGNTWSNGFCGNGIVEGSEQCDPGLGFFDTTGSTCCNEDCTMPTSCLCSKTDPCCDNGAFRPAGYVCRAAQDASCDFAETCSGTSSECPTDTFRSSSTSCTDSKNGQTATGACYKGSCVSPLDRCTNIQPVWIPDCYGQTNVCSQVCCAEENNPTGTQSGPAEDGTPCTTDNGAAGVCQTSSDSNSGSTCTAVTTIKFYHWTLDCPGSAQCRDEEGTVVANNLCQDAPPQCSPSTPTGFPTPQPSLTPQPTTNYPTRFPVTSPTTPFPTLYPTPPTAEPTPFPTPAPVPTEQPTTSPVTMSPTQSPTILQFQTIIVINGDLSSLSTARRDTIKDAILSLLGILDSSISIEFSSGSVIITVTFITYSNGKSPGQSSTELSSQNITSFSSVINETVVSISAAIPLYQNDDPSSSTTGGGDDGLAPGVAAAVALVVIFAVGGVAFAVWWFKCRDHSGKRGGQYLHRDNSPTATKRNIKEFKSTEDPYLSNLGSPAYTSNNQSPVVMAQIVSPVPAAGSPVTLPKGWTQEFAQDGTPFYFHAPTNTSQWNPPASNQAGTM